ncbi:GPW/gp25 family protein [Streptomyces sp. NRRL S-646]|uniref:GPW/gp25 family protein n=1 Tax=Streptomyces sp. NRRL S-646 TaxID=1463917 RepID=UPI0004CC4F4E|nr:GPW/gp25 family protein [Streptomyces sp. NRRL S-646]
MATGFGFPFGVSAAGTIAPDPDAADDLRGRIVQVLFTAPGERVNQPEFGCGLFNLVFDPDNSILAAATEFTIGQALTRWLGDELIVTGVDVAADDGTITVEVAYVSRRGRVQRAVRVSFR